MSEFSHLDESGRLRMVDVTGKQPTERYARASGLVHVGETVLAALQQGTVAKGDVLTVARVAGVQAAKRTSELIPLCHGLSPDWVDVHCELQAPGTVRVVGEARITARTGVEMEAMTAVSVAALTIYDMCKALDKGIELGSIVLEEKSGGKSGKWTRSGNPPPAGASYP